MLRSALSFALLLAWGLGCAPRAPVLPSPTPGSSSDQPGRWTVEVHSGDDAAQAEEIASAARLRFDESVGVAHAGGTYQVHVGSFQADSEAHAFVEVARERGYRSARVVPILSDSPTER